MNPGRGVGLVVCLPVHCRRLAKYLTRDSSTSVAEREGRGHTHHLLALGYMTTSDPSDCSHLVNFYLTFLKLVKHPFL